MSNYAQQMWESQNARQKGRGKSARVLGWTLGSLVALSAVAYLLAPYWYPYVQPYIHL